jgi:hypothetical protein
LEVSPQGLDQELILFFPVVGRRTIPFEVTGDRIDDGRL